jgi:putative transposase
MCAAFAASHQSCGSRRLVTTLSNCGVSVGLVQSSPPDAPHRSGACVEAQVCAYDRQQTGPADCPNILARQFNLKAPNKVYVSDITYIRTRAGWLYLAVVIDSVTRKVIGWAMAPSMPAKLVCDALHMALLQRCPAAGLVIHSDRGTQSASA